MNNEILENKNKKIWLTISSWLFFLLSAAVSLFAPEVSQKVSNFGMIKIF